MPDWLVSFLLGPCYILGNAIWSSTFSLVSGIMSTTPMNFSVGTWLYVEYTLYPWGLGIGLALLNIFMLIGFIRDASDLKQNFTFEIMAMCGIRLVGANILMINGMTIIKKMFALSGTLTTEVFSSSIPTFGIDNFDAGTMLFFAIFGILYVLVALVCGFIILLSVYGRYLKLFVMPVFFPVAVSTIVGGRGMNQTCYAYIKGFLSTTFEIVVIAIFMTVASKMMNHIDFGTVDSGVGSIVDGFGSVLQSILTMILMAGSVKGAEGFMRKFLGI